MHEYISSMLFIFYLLVVNFPLEELLYQVFVLMYQQKFPEDIQCIIEPIQGRGGIFISNIQAAQNPLTLKRLGIQAVITAIKGKNLDKVIPRHIQYMYIPAVDHQSFEINYYFEQSNNFIQEERKRTNVLVHCMAGISRSVTLVIAYMMKYWNYAYDQAYTLVKSKRKIIHPNDSFIRQLKDYEKLLKFPKSEKLKQTIVTRNQNRIQIPKQSRIKIEEKTRNTHQPTRQITKAQKQNLCVVNYHHSLKSTIKIIFKQKKCQNNQSNV